MTAPKRAGKARDKPAGKPIRKPAGDPAGTKAKATAASESPAGVAALGLEHQLGELSHCHAFQGLGPYSTGLARMQQWISAYTDKVIEPKDDDPPGPCGFVPS